MVMGTSPIWKPKLGSLYRNGVPNFDSFPFGDQSLISQNWNEPCFDMGQWLSRPHIKIGTHDPRFETVITKSIWGFMFKCLPISKRWSLFWFGDSIFTISKQGSRYQNGYDGGTSHHFNMVIFDPSTHIKTAITILIWVFNILHFKTGIPISKWVWLY